MNSRIKSKPIKVKINTTFAIGNTEAFSTQFNRNGDLILGLEPGTTVQDLLMQLPGIGDPENWSDLFLHVFVNHKVAGFDQVLEDGDILDLHIPLSGG
jgi:molybdopterin converting factor small subunit